MKQLKLTALLAIICISVQSQTYLSSSILNKGVEARLGYLSDKVDISAGVQLPLTEVQVPTIYSITVGRVFYLSQMEDGITITPAVGIAGLTRQKMVEEYPFKSAKQSEVAAYYSLEVGKDSYMGRIFGKVMYSKPYYKVTNGLYYAVGMRFFFGELFN